MLANITYPAHYFVIDCTGTLSALAIRLILYASHQMNTCVFGKICNLAYRKDIFTHRFDGRINMKSNLLKRVEEHRKKQQPVPLSLTRLYIISNRKEIQRALNHGYSIKILWNVLKQEGHIKCGYARFCEALKKHLSEKSEIKCQNIVETKQSIIQIETKRSTNLNGFIFNPIPIKEELY